MSASIKKPHALQQANLIAVLWTAPALVFYALFALIPMLIALYLSFTQWNGISEATWVGLRNWVTLFSDNVTGHAII